MRYNKWVLQAQFVIICYGSNRKLILIQIFYSSLQIVAVDIPVLQVRELRHTEVTHPKTPSRKAGILAGEMSIIWQRVLRVCYTQKNMLCSSQKYMKECNV